jgi:hypothetical protein
VASTVDRLFEAEVLPQGASIANLWHDRIDYGAPSLPRETRGETLAEITALLARHGVLCCGRLGAWDARLAEPEALFLAGVRAAEEALEVVSARPRATAVTAAVAETLVIGAATAWSSRAEPWKQTGRNER